MALAKKKTFLWAFFVVYLESYFELPKPYPPNIFFLKMSAFYLCCIYCSALHTRFYGTLIRLLPQSNQWVHIVCNIGYLKNIGRYIIMLSDKTDFKGAQWLSGRVLDSRLRGRGLEPHRRHCVVSLNKTHYS